MPISDTRGSVLGTVIRDEHEHEKGHTRMDTKSDATDSRTASAAGGELEAARIRAYRQARIFEPSIDGYNAAMSVYEAAFGGEPPIISTALSVIQDLIYALKIARPCVAAFADTSHLLQGFSPARTVEDEWLVAVDAAIAKAEGR